MDVVIWIAQGLLAAAFLGAGLMKVSQPTEKLVAAGMDWIKSSPGNSAKPLGALEVLAAIGLILPAATGIAPVLTPIAAVGTVIVMIGAVALHAAKKEWQSVGITVVLGALGVFVAITRFGPYSIE